ncbi:MAG: NAD(P)H-quinone oxidoreductase [Angustibacter sp.]
MRAITTTGPGGPGVLVLQDVPEPVPGPGELLIRVAAAGVNRADVLQRLGRYPPPPGASPLLGLECSGTVAAVGDRVAPGTWQAGDQVCALLSGGGYAELVAVAAEHVLPLPGGVSLVEAAALPEVACAVWSNLVSTARLAPGELVLIHGGSGGIGTMAIQIARQLGARVAVTASSSAKLDRCRELGAQLLVNYQEQDFVEALRAQTAGRGVDVVLDVVGAAYLQRNVDVLATGGRLVVIGLQGGRRGELDLSALLAKRATVAGTSLRGRATADKAMVVAGVRRYVWPMIAADVVQPVVDRIFPLADAAQAHQVMESAAHVGKVVLTV